MTTFSMSAARSVPGCELGAPDETDGAMIHAADKYSRGLGARTSGPANTRAPRRPEPSAAAREALPDGYLPVRDVKDVTLLGYWPPLDDRMSPCLPTRTIAAMRHRSALGDHDAETWLNLHARACTGDPEAQRAFGRVCENGSYRVQADVQRAFFWYYRAGLQGDIEARRNAERLMQRSTRISPATMAEPLLIYPGRWRITAHLSEQLHSASMFDLINNGSATGWLLGNPESSVETPPDTPGVAEPGSDGPSRSSAMQKSCYRGGWAYDGIGRVLTIIFESGDGERRWRNANWQIELLGCKPGALFGRDRRMVGYTLEHLPQVAGRDE